MEKHTWESEIEVIRFADTDVITTSEFLDPDEQPSLDFG